MSFVVELTCDDNRRIGLARDTALILLDVSDGSWDQNPKAKTMIRYVTQQGAAFAFVKDAFDHVLSLFPAPFGGGPWAQLKDVAGRKMAIADKRAIFYEERADKKGFDVRFAIPTGPVLLPVAATFEEVQAMLVEEPEEQPPPPVPLVPGPPAEEGSNVVPLPTAPAGRRARRARRKAD